MLPAKSLLQDMFNEQRTALILDELQTWFDGLQDDPSDHGPKRRQWAFNFLQILSELAKDRPDLLCLVVSVRDSTTEAFRQVHRVGPILIDFKGETAREDRKRLLLHRLFQNRDNFGDAEIDQAVATYATERVRLLYSDRTAAEQARLRQEVAQCWPFAPELLNLLEDNILMAAAAQDNRDLIRILAEVYRERKDPAAVVTPADFSIENDDCGVTSLLDAFTASADQEKLREKAIRNLKALRDASVPAPHALAVISSLWMRSLSPAHDAGGTRQEVQLDVTRDAPVDDNSFTLELAEIIDSSFNIHEVGTTEKRYCFRLPENPVSKVKAWARNDHSFVPQTAAAPGLLPVGRDQDYVRKALNGSEGRRAASATRPCVPLLNSCSERAYWLGKCDTRSMMAERTVPKNIFRALAWPSRRLEGGASQAPYPLGETASRFQATDRQALEEPLMNRSKEKDILIGHKDSFAVRFAFLRDPHEWTGGDSRRSGCLGEPSRFG